jgi:hypothetical protein
MFNEYNVSNIDNLILFIQNNEKEYKLWKKYFENEDIVFNIMKKKGEYIKYCPIFQNNRNIVKEAVNNYGYALFYCPEFQDDKEIISIAINNEPFTINDYDLFKHENIKFVLMEKYKTSIANIEQQKYNNKTTEDKIKNKDINNKKWNNSGIKKEEIKIIEPQPVKRWYNILDIFDFWSFLDFRHNNDENYYNNHHNHYNNYQ